jgi:translation initiation factor 3 subunit E
LVTNLDRHLAIPLLDHLAETDLFQPQQILKAQYELVKETNMVDYVESLYSQANEAGASVEAIS